MITATAVSGPEPGGRADRAALVVEHLTCTIPGPDGSELRLVNDVSFTLTPGKTLGIVGESGSGKTMLVRSIMGIGPPTTSVTGSVLLNGRELLNLPSRQRREVDALQRAWHGGRAGPPSRLVDEGVQQLAVPALHAVHDVSALPGREERVAGAGRDEALHLVGHGCSRALLHGLPTRLRRPPWGGYSPPRRAGLVAGSYTRRAPHGLSRCPIHLTGRSSFGAQFTLAPGFSPILHERCGYLLPNNCLPPMGHGPKSVTASVPVTRGPGIGFRIDHTAARRCCPCSCGGHGAGSEETAATPGGTLLLAGFSGGRYVGTSPCASDWPSRAAPP